MPRVISSNVPAYRRHKASGQAVVHIAGQCKYLGVYGTKESRQRYDQFIGEWLAAGRQLPRDPNAITIAEVAVAFRKHAATYYAGPDGKTTNAAANIYESLRYVLKLYGRTPAIEFGPLKLKAVRQAMMDEGRVRSNINRHISRIKSVFRWASENELIPGAVYHGLAALSGLRRGHSEAVESDPVQPVAVEHVETVLPFVSPQVAAMVRLQLASGMRPGEVVIMRGCDIEANGKLWVYRPSKHKTMNRGHERTIFLGPKAQAIIQPFLKPDLQAFIFSPADADAWRRAKLHAQRKTPMSCGNKPGSNCQRYPGPKPGDCYAVVSYARAIRRGCESAFPPPADMADAEQVRQWRKAHHFHPHQLRHTAATELRKTHGLEAAQVVLGHKAIAATQIYAEKNNEQAMRIMAEVG